MKHISADKLIGKTMLKTFLFVILFMLMKPALAASLMSHEKFVHLDYLEQRKIVIATMELIVEMESKYHKQVKTSGFDPERFRLYTDFIKKVSGLIFPEAHADTRNVRYGQYLNELRTVLNQRNKCLYGGWISSMVGDKCTHPSRGSAATLYQAESGCTGGVNQITCNPAIFGFKNVSTKTLFCVAAGEGRADNSSRDCMTKALADPAESGASTREQRIRNMVEGIAANPNDANAVFDFLLRACACDASKSRQISEHYANYMRPHQTCYSILRMMSEVTPQCQMNPQLMNANQTTFLADIKTVLTREEIVSTSVADTYKSKVDQFVSRADHQAICGPTTGGGPSDRGSPNPTPDPDPEPDPDPDQNCVEERTPLNKLCCRPGRKANADETNCVDDPTPGDNDNSEGEEIVVTGRRPTPETPTPTPDPTPTITTTTDTPPTPDPTPTATTTCTGDLVPEGAADACVPKCNLQTEKRNDETHACDCKEGTRDEAGLCPVPPTPDEESSSTTNVSLTVTGKNKDGNITTVTAAITPDATPASDYIIMWFSKGSTRPNASNFSGTSTVTTRSATDIVGSINDAPESGAPAETNPDWDKIGDGESKINRDDSKSLDAPRLSNDYQMCARLIKKSDHSMKGEKCATVPKKAAPRPSGNANPFGQPQMGPTRGGASDAIFRGVR